MHPSLNLDEAALARFCATHHIRGLSLFGSQLKGTAGSGERYLRFQAVTTARLPKS